MSSNQGERVLSWAVKIGLWIIPLLPFYVSSSMLFPFITGKNFAFRIIIEIIFALWLGLIAVWPSWRPRLTLPVKLATIFILVLFFADLFSPNPWRSFFSNYERMEGFMMLSHLYLYFLMLVSMFRTRRDWMTFFHITLVASLAIAFVGLLQRFGLRVSLQGGFRVDSTIGNPTYLAVYLFFHLWILLILIREFWRFWWLRLLYGAAFLFELMIMYFTASRGAMAAFIIVVPLTTALLIIFWSKVFPKYGQYRKFVAVFLVLMVIAPMALWLLRDTRLVNSSRVLNRFTSVSTQDRTTQARFSIWQMSFKGFLERPILGWGQENYYLVFQKYFDSKLYSSEPWFDRSHNIVFDWLIHAGLLGFLAFFSLLGSVFYLLWRGIRQSSISPWSGIMLLGAFSAYFIQNIFVFDNLNSYLLLFALFAYVNGISYANIDQTISPARKQNLSVGMVMATLALILVGVVGYSINIKAMRESRALLKSLQYVYGKAPVEVFMPEFQKALSYNTFGNTEVREQAANMARNVVADPNIAPEKRLQFAEFIIGELRKETNHQAKDVKHLLFLASVLSLTAPLKPEYALEAEQVLQEAVRLSPTKQIIYFELGQLYLRTQHFNEALQVLKKAALLEPEYAQAYSNFLIAAVLANNKDAIAEARAGLDMTRLDGDALLRVAAAFLRVSDFVSAREAYELLIKTNPASADILGELGEYDMAIKESETAAGLDEAFAPEAKVFTEIMRQRKK
ncbi:MAG: O-antigen ligase family protein [Candidatus Sungbacteria bacterium]|nr:O-antigen ligase family protein [Candidatus Sungbacteria bacterium]